MIQREMYSFGYLLIICFLYSLHVGLCLVTIFIHLINDCHWVKRLTKKHQFEKMNWKSAKSNDYVINLMISQKKERKTINNNCVYVAGRIPVQHLFTITKERKVKCHKSVP